jgi:hypothetical protein
MAIWTRAALVLQCLCRSSKKAVASEGKASDSRHKDTRLPEAILSQRI